jgi:hypothetical protein
LVYQLPTPTDVESDPFTITLQSGPVYVSLDAVTFQLSISPSITTLSETASVTIVLADQFGSNVFTMIVTVVNTPPVFNTSIVDQYIN